MKAVLHPTYFPSVAHFVAIANYDVVFETTDNYQKQTYRNRAYVYGTNGKQLLSVPVKHTKKDGHQKYKDVRIEHNFNWRKQHQKTLETLYRSSPFFEFYEDDLLPIFEKKYAFLLDLNFETIAFVCRCLQIEMHTIQTTLTTKSNSDSIALKQLSDAKHERKFAFEKYDQVFQEKQGFIENLSVLDLLFNKGPSAISYLENQNLSIA